MNEEFRISYSKENLMMEHLWGGRNFTGPAWNCAGED